MEELKRGTDQMEGREMPTVDTLMEQLDKLQQGKTSMEEKMDAVKSLQEFLCKEQETLQLKATQLEEMYSMKQETCQVLQFQCEESGQEAVRQVVQNTSAVELLRQHECETQEVKLKHRKQRMMFENQLLQLLGLHKKLHCVFNPKRLPAEIEKAETRRRQLLSAEEQKLAELRHLEEVCEKMKEQQ